MLCLALLLQISISITFSFFNPSSTSSWDPKHFTMATIQRCFLCPSRPTALWLYATLNEWLDLYTASSTIHQSGYCTCTYTHTHIQTCACAHTHTHTPTNTWQADIQLLHTHHGGGDSSVVRAPDSWLKGRGFESLLERRENFLLQGRLSVLTLISVSVPPPCYRK